MTDSNIENLSVNDPGDDLVPEDWLWPKRHEPGGNASQVPMAPLHAREQVYHQLNPNLQELDIRLLEIELEDDEQGRMCCILRQTPLEEAPPYYALSYWWGDSSPSIERKIINVNGFEFKILPNLWDALQALRTRGHFMIWVDALSLDQGDDQEKAQQVPRIKAIYQHAQGVAVWLGEEADGSTEFMQSVSRLAQAEIGQAYDKWMTSGLANTDDEKRKPVPRSAALENFLPIVRLLQERESEAGSDDLADEELDVVVARIFPKFMFQLESFFSRPYWRRIWVIQEVASARHVEVLCGDQCILWDELVTLCVFDDGREPKWDEIASVGAHNMDTIRKLKYKVANRLPIGLLTGLQYSTGSEAGRAQDKFYALLGLCWDSDRYIRTVSYAGDFTQNKIMFDMTKHWLNSGQLDVICLQPLNIHNDFGLPSWLPKWLSIGRRFFCNRLIDFIENRQPSSGPTKFPHRWTATGRSRSTQHAFLDRGRVLRVRGVHVATIDGLAAACNADEADPLARRSWDSTSPAPNTIDEMRRIRSDLYWTLNMYKKTSANGIPDQTLNLDVLWSDEARRRLEEDDHNSEGMFAWLDALSKFRIFGRPFDQWLRNRPQFRNAIKLEIMNRLVRDAQDRTYIDEHHGNVLSAMTDVFHDGRRLMTTKEEYVGWAHPNARPGDRIYLLEGCNVPVILAPCGHPYQGRQTCLVVGDAYVHRIMYGELWKANSGQLTDLYLR